MGRTRLYLFGQVIIHPQLLSDRGLIGAVEVIRRIATTNMQNSSSSTANGWGEE